MKSLSLCKNELILSASAPITSLLQSVRHEGSKSSLNAQFHSAWENGKADALWEEDQCTLRRHFTLIKIHSEAFRRQSRRVGTGPQWHGWSTGHPKLISIQIFSRQKYEREEFQMRLGGKFEENFACLRHISMQGRTRWLPELLHLLSAYK